MALLLQPVQALAQETVLVPGTLFAPPVPPPATGFGRAVGGRVEAPFGSGAVLVVGAPLAPIPGGITAGRVYAFPDPYDVTQVEALESPASAAGGQFGAAVAGIGDDLLVGAPGENAGAGVLYRVDLPAQIDTVPNHPPVPGEAFGAAIASAGTLAVVGAPAFGDQAAPGTAYLIDVSDPASAALELRRPEPTAGALFGAAVALSSGDAFVGAPFEGGAGRETGAAYRFAAATGNFVRGFANPRGGVQDGFGAAVAAGADFLVVGAPFADAGANGAGEVHVFAANGPLLRTIGNPNPTVDAGFGAAVAVVGGRILVGVPFDDGDVEDGGAVYVFDGDRSSATFGMPLDPGRLRLPAPSRSAHFGFSIGAVGTAGDVVAGAPGRDDVGNGVAMVFAACGNGELAGEQCDPPEPGKCSDACIRLSGICGNGDSLALASFDRAVPAAFVDCACPAGSTCDDRVACTANDACTGVDRECAGTPNDGLCNDGNPCTTDRCAADAGCVNEPIACPDDGDPCTVDECAPATGACSRRALGCDCRTDTECDDANACNGSELCVRPCKGCNLFRAALPCCDRERTCQLEFAAPPSGASCDDRNACTAGDVCQPAGACAGDPVAGVSSVCCVFQGLGAVDACSGQRIDRPQRKIDRAATLAAKACAATKPAKQRGLVRKEIRALRQAGAAARKLARSRGRRASQITEACRDALVALSEQPAETARAFLSSIPRR